MTLDPTAYLRQKRHPVWNTYYLQQWWYDYKNDKGVWKNIKKVPHEAPNDVKTYNKKE